MLTHVSSPTGARSLDTLKSAIGTFSSQLKTEHKSHLDDALKLPAQQVAYEPIGEPNQGKVFIQSLTGMGLHHSFNKQKTLT